MYGYACAAFSVMEYYLAYNCICMLKEWMYANVKSANISLTGLIIAR